MDFYICFLDKFPYLIQSPSYITDYRYLLEVSFAYSDNTFPDIFLLALLTVILILGNLWMSMVEIYKVVKSLTRISEVEWRL